MGTAGQRTLLHLQASVSQTSIPGSDQALPELRKGRAGPERRQSRGTRDRAAFSCSVSQAPDHRQWCQPCLSPCQRGDRGTILLPFPSSSARNHWNWLSSSQMWAMNLWWRRNHTSTCLTTQEALGQIFCCQGLYSREQTCVLTSARSWAPPEPQQGSAEEYLSNAWKFQMRGISIWDGDLRAWKTSVRSSSPKLKHAQIPLS